MASPNTNVDRISALIVDDFAPRVRELVFNQHPFLKLMHTSRFADLVEGGDFLRHPLTFQFTQDGAYAAYEPGNTAAEEQETAARFRWKRNRQHYSIDNGEVLQGMGKSAMFKHLSVGTINSMSALRDSVATQMLFYVVSGNLIHDDAAKQMNSLAGLLADDAWPSATLTIGQIQKTAARTWWHGKNVDGGANALTYADITAAYWLAQDGGFGLTQWICHNDDADKLDDLTASTSSNERYIQNMGDDARVGAGAIVTRLKGKPLIADKHATPFVIYGINEADLSLQTHQARDFRFAGFKEPHNQDTRIGWWYHMGNFTIGDPRRSVVIRNFT